MRWRLRATPFLESIIHGRSKRWMSGLVATLLAGSTSAACVGRTGSCARNAAWPRARKEGKRGRGAEAKTIVAVAAEKSGRAIGRIRLRRIKDVSADSLLPFVQSVVAPGSAVHTDGWRGYSGLANAGYQHPITVISDGLDPAHEVMPRVHTVASLLKRWLLGTHQGGIQATTPRLLPRRIHFSVQPATLKCSPVAVPQARPAGDCGRARALQFDCRSRPDEEINLTGVKEIPILRNYTRIKFSRSSSDNLALASVPSSRSLARSRLKGASRGSFLQSSRAR